jgi:hypothetical protein
MEAAHLRENAGDDAGRGDEGDAAQEYGGQGLKTEEQAGDEAGGEIEEEVDGRAGQAAAQILLELLTRVFEAEHEEQKEDADLRANLDEALCQVEGSQAAIAEG